MMARMKKGDKSVAKAKKPAKAVAKTKKNGQAKPAKKKRFISMSRMIKLADIPKNVLKLIEKVTTLEEKEVAVKAEQQALLEQIQNTLQGCSFEHPTKGPMTIMERVGRWFWRSKPAGRERTE